MIVITAWEFVWVWVGALLAAGVGVGLGDWHIHGSRTWAVKFPFETRLVGRVASRYASSSQPIRDVSEGRIDWLCNTDTGAKPSPR